MHQRDGSNSLGGALKVVDHFFGDFRCAASAGPIRVGITNGLWSRVKCSRMVVSCCWLIQAYTPAALKAAAVAHMESSLTLVGFCDLPGAPRTSKCLLDGPEYEL